MDNGDGQFPAGNIFLEKDRLPVQFQDLISRRFRLRQGSGDPQPPAHVLESRFQNERGPQPGRDLLLFAGDHDAGGYRKTEGCQPALGGDFIVGQKAGRGVRPDDPGPCGFQHLPDESPEEPAALEGIGVIDDPIAVTGEIVCPRFDFLRIRQKRFVTQGLQAEGRRFRAAARGPDCMNNADFHNFMDESGKTF